MEFPGGSSSKEHICQRRRSKRRGSGRSPRGENGNPLQYSCQDNPMDRGAWRAIVHRVSESQTWLSNWTTTTYATHQFKSVPVWVPEKAMAPHSSTLAWKISWMEEPGRLQSMGPLRVGHDSVTSRSLFTFMHWKRKWQPTPVFLPGEPQGRWSLVGCHLLGCRVRHDWSNLA